MALTTQPCAFINARLIDPESGYDGPGALVVSNGLITQVVHSAQFDGPSPDMRIIDCNGAMLAPGLIDLRVKTGEPGAETKETLKSAARAAAAGGVTSIVVQPDTDPAVDDPAMVDFILRRARDIELVHVYPAGAATKGLGGERMAEIGLMRDAGAVYFTDSAHSIVNSKVLQRILTYAKGCGAVVAHHACVRAIRTTRAARGHAHFGIRLAGVVRRLRVRSRVAAALDGWSAEPA